MTIFAFLLGLAVGIGFWIWQQTKLDRQLQQMLESLPNGLSGASLPLISRLRRVIALTNQYQKALEAQLQTWQQLLQSAPIGYLQVDEENQLLWCNELGRQLLQIQRWEPGQVRLLLELVRSYELDQLIEQTRQQQQFSQQEWIFHPACSDAAAMVEVRSLSVRASSFPLPQGQVGVFIENLQPLVELRQSRDRWISDLAHELRTPLTSIYLVAETLQTRLQLTKEGRWIDKMLPEINRLINLVEDWLQLSQMEKYPSKNLTVKPVELKTLIHSVWQTLEPLAKQKQLSLNYSGPDVLTLSADPSRLTQVFLNLFDNSIKYSPEAAEIEVEINIPLKEDASNLVEINIIDSGPGFEDSDIPHVFERLYRGDPSRARRQTSSPEGEPFSSEIKLVRTSGSGLGLAIVQQIILAHGGSVSARNHPETGGAWLQIKLPFS